MMRVRGCGRSGYVTDANSTGSSTFKRWVAEAVFVPQARAAVRSFFE